MDTEEVIGEHEVAVAAGVVDHIMVKVVAVARSGSRETRSQEITNPIRDPTE